MPNQITAKTSTQASSSVSRSSKPSQPSTASAKSVKLTDLPNEVLVHVFSMTRGSHTRVHSGKIMEKVAFFLDPSKPNLKNKKIHALSSLKDTCIRFEKLISEKSTLNNECISCFHKNDYSDISYLKNTILENLKIKLHNLAVEIVINYVKPQTQKEFCRKYKAMIQASI
jgi:hypothetical protein